MYLKSAFQSGNELQETCEFSALIGMFKALAANGKEQKTNLGK